MSSLVIALAAAFGFAWLFSHCRRDDARGASVVELERELEALADRSLVLPRHLGVMVGLAALPAIAVQQVVWALTGALYEASLAGALLGSSIMLVWPPIFLRHRRRLVRLALTNPA